MRALLLVLQAEAHLLASLRGNSSSTAPIDRAARPQRAAQANQNQCAFKAFSDVEELLKKRRREKGPGDFAKPLAHVTDTSDRSDKGWIRKPQKDESLERKERVGFIIPLSRFRFPYFLEFHKQMQSCAPFGSQADVFVAFSSVEDMRKYWNDFRSLSTWQIPSDWEYVANVSKDNIHHSLPSCTHITEDTEACEESGVTSVIVPREYWENNMAIPWRSKKLFLAAWVLSNRPGYRFLGIPDSELRITDCRVFRDQSLLAAIEESYAKKRWTGGPCDPRGSCGIQLASAALVASSEELAGLERAGATCALTYQNDFPWVEATSFIDMLKAVALKFNVQTGRRQDILDLVKALHKNGNFLHYRYAEQFPSAQIMYHMWMALHHGFRVVHRHSDCGNSVALSKCSAGPHEGKFQATKMDWAPMWVINEWCYVYNPPSSRRPFFFFDLDSSSEMIPSKYYQHKMTLSPTTGKHIIADGDDWEDYDYMTRFKDDNMLYVPAGRVEGKRCFRCATSGKNPLKSQHCATPSICADHACA